MLAPVLQPIRAKYGGQGLAKPSAFVDIADANFSEILRRLYDEHVEGFSGKSYKKMGNVQDAMEWRVRLKAKAERDGTVLVKKKRESAASPRGGGGASPEDEAEGRTEKGKKPAGGAHWSRSSATPAPRRALEGRKKKKKKKKKMPASISPRWFPPGRRVESETAQEGGAVGLTPEAMLALQTSKVKVKVDESARESAMRRTERCSARKHRANGEARGGGDGRGGGARSSRSSRHRSYFPYVFFDKMFRRDAEGTHRSSLLNLPGSHHTTLFPSSTPSSRRSPPRRRR